MAEIAERKLFIERRTNARYPLVFDVQYRRTGEKHYHPGLTIDVSSSGVRFRCSESIPINTELIVLVSWPVLLEGSCPLKLAMSGKAVWSSSTECALRVYTYEFRTSGKRTELAFTPFLQKAVGGV